MGFLFVSLLIAAVALSMSQGATATIERRLGECAARVMRSPGAERLTARSEAGQDGAAVASDLARSASA
jgi:hypothetical protein